jgi:hypothetical protein
MKRVLVAAAVVSAIFAAARTNVSAATVQFSKNSAVTFTVQLPTGWTASGERTANRYSIFFRGGASRKQIA